MSSELKKCVLVTGGAGYIGSHTAVALHESGYVPVLLDNLDNSELSAVEGIRALCGTDVRFIQADIRDAGALRGLFAEMRDAGTPLEGILHFAAHKAVGESVDRPAKYASNNVGGLGTLLEVADEFDVRNVVFSSSCTVYGEPENVPVDESAPFQEAESPYGWTKQASERVLTDHAATHPKHRVALLRYFNPIGAHPTALLGELPLGVPNNLVPFLTQAVAGIRGELTVFGGDYPTPDGTCIRDYLHVLDLAEAHVAALAWCFRQEADEAVVRAFNLGTGQGASVLEVIQAFERATGERVPYRMGERRAGDVVAIWADPTRAKKELGWATRRSLETSLADSWKWQQALKKA
jgi:UDP-glucose 4-epimerase